MKKIPLLFALVLLLSPKAFGAPDTNAVYLEVLQASNSVVRIVQVLPDIEKLWPQDPDAYLKSARQALGTLGGTLNDANTRTAFLQLFASMMQKTCPTNEESAISWLRSKRDTILFYSNFGEIRNDKGEWLAIAKFIGEIRSRTIPNYAGQAMTFSGMATTPEEKLELRKQMAENERKKITDVYQSELSQSDSVLTALLQYGCPYTQPNIRADTNFLDQIVSAARLTSEEIKALKNK